MSRPPECSVCKGDACLYMPGDPRCPEGRPGGWVDGIGWVALLCDLPVGSKRRYSVTGPVWERSTRVFDGPADQPVIVTEWPDGSAPKAPQVQS